MIEYHVIVFNRVLKMWKKNAKVTCDAVVLPQVVKCQCNYSEGIFSIFGLKLYSEPNNFITGQSYLTYS